MYYHVRANKYVLDRHTVTQTDIGLTCCTKLTRHNNNERECNRLYERRCLSLSRAWPCYTWQPARVTWTVSDCL